ncbi:hypothetical protein A11M_0106410 [Xanthomonas vasicola pv. vasculorum NCPPB 895]|nr:hypothetical protein A11M_0106410 [Xanthomonas vasicola pv. vasculorum NCPPB 895]
MFIDHAVFSQFFEQKMIAKNILLNYMVTMKDDLIGGHAFGLFVSNRQLISRSVDKSDSACPWRSAKPIFDQRIT